LGVDQKASEQEIKRAFRKKAVREHPDKGGDPEKVIHSIMLSLKNSHTPTKFSLTPASVNFTMNMVRKV
jgi:curved DNA-binding protein CbpA